MYLIQMLNNYEKINFEILNKSKYNIILTKKYVLNHQVIKCLIKVY